MRAARASRLFFLVNQSIIISANRGVVRVIHVVVATATDQCVHQKVISRRRNAFLPFDNGNMKIMPESMFVEKK